MWAEGWLPWGPSVGFPGPGALFKNSVHLSGCVQRTGRSPFSVVVGLAGVRTSGSLPGERLPKNESFRHLPPSAVTSPTFVLREAPGISWVNEAAVALKPGWNGGGAGPEGGHIHLQRSGSLYSPGACCSLILHLGTQQDCCPVSKQCGHLNRCHPHTHAVPRAGGGAPI